MEEEKIITDFNAHLIWLQIETEIQSGTETLQYHAVLEQHERRVILDIENNHEVGFKAEKLTSFTSYLYSRNGFRFAIYPQKGIDKLGKYLGMQDFEIGFRDFDEKFIVKASDEKTVVDLFTDGSIRKTLISLPDLTFSIVEYKLEDGDGKAPFLELKIDNAITDVIILQTIYNIFYEMLLKIES